MRTVRLLLVLAALGLLAWGLFRQSSRVRALDGSAERAVDGRGFTAGATYDAFLLRDGGLAETRSLQPEAAQSKDCKT